jgi:hypothetical protein
LADAPLIVPKTMQPGQDPMAQPLDNTGPIIVPKAMQPGTSAPVPAPATSQPKTRVGKVMSAIGIGKAGSPEAKAYNMPPSIQPLVNGFNNRLVDLTGLPVDAVDGIFKAMGDEGFLDNDEPARDVFKRKLAEYGFPITKVDTEAERIGYQLFDNLVIAAVTMGTGIFTNATIKMVGPAKTALQRGLQQITQTAANHPTATIVSEVGSAIGQETLGPALAPTIGEGPAEIVGATVGGMTPETTTARAMARLTGGALGGMGGLAGGSITGHPLVAGIGASVGFMRGARAGRNMMDKLLAERLEHPKAFMTMDSPEAATEYARYAIEGDIAAADAAITRQVQAVGGIADPTRRAEKLHDLVSGLYGKSQQRATELWNKVDQSRPVASAIPMLKDFSDKMRAEAGEFNEGLPERFLGLIDEIAAGIGNGKAIDTKRAPDGSVEIITTPGHVFSIQDARNIQQSIQADLRAGVTNATLKRNLTLLNQALDGMVQQVYPNDGTLAAAREYTKWLHNTFSRGAVGAFLGNGKPAGQFLTAPQARALSLLDSEKGGAQLADAAKALKSKKVEAELANFMAAEFQQRATDLGPEKGLAFLQAPSTKHFLANFPKEAARMDRIATDLDVALDTRKTINTSYFYRFSGADPQVAASRILSSPKKIQDMQAVVTRLEEDESGRALEGLRGALIHHMLSTTKNNPARFRNLLADKDMRAAFTVAFGNKMPRLDHLLESLVKYGGSNADLATAKVDEAVGGIVGAKLGGKIPGGGIQTPGMAANLSRWATRQMFGRREVSELIELALTDPKWEAYVRAKVPSNLTEMRAEVDNMVSLLAATNGAIAGFGGATE